MMPPVVLAMLSLAPLSAMAESAPPSVSPPPNPTAAVLLSTGGMAAIVAGGMLASAPYTNGTPFTPAGVLVGAGLSPLGLAAGYVYAGDPLKAAVVPLVGLAVAPTAYFLGQRLAYDQGTAFSFPIILPPLAVAAYTAWALNDTAKTAASRDRIPASEPGREY